MALGQQIKNIVTGQKVLLDHRGQPIRSKAAARDEVLSLQRTIYKNIQARYESSQEKDYNATYWANADHRSPDSANSAQVRKKIRSRARYEVVENNPYLKGAALTLCNDFTGSGPSLKVTDGRLTTDEKNAIQDAWRDWFSEIKLRQKIWEWRMDRLSSGEAFGVKISRDKNKKNSKLSVRPFECDHVESPYTGDLSNIVNGVEIDEYLDEPTRYYIYKSHPGSSSFTAMALDGAWEPAANVIHWFRRERKWRRGIPEITPSLPLCSLLRRYTIATVLAAETAADLTAIVEDSNALPQIQSGFWSGNTSVDGSVKEEELDIFPVEVGMMMSLPKGKKISQLDPKQPTAVYDKFVDALLREIFRPILVPFNVGSGYSGAFNMASGSLDMQLYRTGIETDRMSVDEEILETLTEDWWIEIVLMIMEGEIDTIPMSVIEKLDSQLPRHTYGWDSVRDEHTDPSKVANSIATKLTNGIISDEDVQQSLFNRSAEVHYENLRKQQEAREKLGLPIGGGSGQAPPKKDPNNPDPNDPNEDTEQDPPPEDPTT